jgi:transposase-like protein
MKHRDPSPRVKPLRRPLRNVAALLEEAEKEACSPSPLPRHYSLILRSTNLLERVHREIGRCTDVVGIFPHDRALIASALARHRAEPRVTGGPPLPLSPLARATARRR